MPQTQTHAEPSMEEILASIRRIISEEEHAGAANGAAVLDPANTNGDAAPADDLVVFDAAPALVRTKPSPLDQVRPAGPAPDAPVNGVDPKPAAQATSEPKAASSPALEPRIVSPPAATAASGAMTRLAGAMRIADEPGQSLEGLVREMLKPMLKEWLDQHLPAIVEAKVEAELERIARLAR